MFSFLISRSQMLDQMQLEVLHLSQPLIASWTFESWQSIMDESVVVKSP